MLNIDKDGNVIHIKIRRSIRTAIQHGDMPVVQGIIVHQTASPTAESTLNSYTRPKANGAHFLIDRDGTIYQTASVFKQTWHVGKLRVKCYKTHSCSPKDMEAVRKARLEKNPSVVASKESEIESSKSIPNRYPSNRDSIGIEIVGMAYDVRGKTEKVFETVSDRQNSSLRWLVSELMETLRIEHEEIFRHPEVSKKNLTEASTAAWK